MMLFTHYYTFPLLSMIVYDAAREQIDHSPFMKYKLHVLT